MRAELRMEGDAEESPLTTAPHARPDVEVGSAQHRATPHRPHDAGLLDHEQSPGAVARRGDVDRAAESADDLVEGHRDVARRRRWSRGDRAGRSGDETADGKQGGYENPTNTHL